MLFRLAANAGVLGRLRRPVTRDIVRRLTVIPPGRLVFEGYPADHPVSAFNPALVVEGGEVVVYARVVMGYYSTRYDVYGAEDPRVTVVDSAPCMTYVGRTVNYFKATVRYEKSLPIVAVRREDGSWEKRLVLVLPWRLRRLMVSDRDAFVVETRDRDLLVFHRPQMVDDRFYLVVSRASRDSLKRRGGLVEVEVGEPTLLLEPMPCELKIGWAAPPIEVEPNTYLTLVHGVDREVECYRVFAALVRYDRDVGPRIISVTPHYVMEPRAPYELYGERPYTVFPCGLHRVDEDRLLVSYGAADYFIGVGELDLSELLAELDKHRVEWEGGHYSLSPLLAARCGGGLREPLAPVAWRFTSIAVMDHDDL